MAQKDHVEAVDLLKDEFVVDDIMCKVNAMYRIPTVVAALDYTRITNNLIPFLMSMSRSKCSFGTKRRR
jgi:hypothetical protein